MIVCIFCHSAIHQLRHSWCLCSLLLQSLPLFVSWLFQLVGVIQKLQVKQRPKRWWLHSSPLMSKFIQCCHIQANPFSSKSSLFLTSCHFQSSLHQSPFCLHTFYLLDRIREVMNECTAVFLRLLENAAYGSSARRMSGQSTCGELSGVPVTKSQLWTRLDSIGSIACSAQWRAK